MNIQRVSASWKDETYLTAFEEYEKKYDINGYQPEAEADKKISVKAKDKDNEKSSGKKKDKDKKKIKEINSFLFYLKKEQFTKSCSFFVCILLTCNTEMSYP